MRHMKDGEAKEKKRHLISASPALSKSAVRLLVLAHRPVAAWKFASNYFSMADPAAIVIFVDEAASLGIKVAFALSSLAEIVKTSSRRLQSLSDDVYATCSLL
jgi:hypothetical protein